eukprot:3347521-Amphidinium_carterae.2
MGFSSGTVLNDVLESVQTPRTGKGNRCTREVGTSKPPKLLQALSSTQAVSSRVKTKHSPSWTAKSHTTVTTSPLVDFLGRSAPHVFDILVPAIMCFLASVLQVLLYQASLFTVKGMRPG